MISLSCQFKMYVNIMLEINKMVQDGRVKSTRGAMIPPEGKRKGGPFGEKNPMLTSINLRTHLKFVMCFK